MNSIISPIIAVVGAGSCSADIEQMAEQTGRIIAENGAILICGGLSGVMNSACKGAKSAGGTTIGILPTDQKSTANEYVDIAIPTGLGQARNLIIINSADVVIALPGKYGTLSEIAFALKLGKPIVSMSNWDVDEGIIVAENPKDAVNRALELVNSN